MTIVKYIERFWDNLKKIENFLHDYVMSHQNLLESYLMWIFNAHEVLT